MSGTLPATLFSDASRLSHLYAFGARRLSGTLPSAIGDARSLQELELSSCHLSGSLPPEIGARGASSALRYVFLESNRLSGIVPPSLGKLRRIRELELSHNRLSGSVPRGVARMQIDHLDFEDNAPGMKGAPVSKPKQGCSGGSAKYMRAGGAPAQAVAAGGGALADRLEGAVHGVAASGSVPAAAGARARGLPREQSSEWLSPPPPR